MFGRKHEEDIFEKEERLRRELQGARQQLEQTVTRLADVDAQYRREASAALDTGNEQAALALYQERERLGVKRDGINHRLAQLEPQAKEATRVAQAERAKIAQAERRVQFDKLLGRGRAAARRILETHEEFMRAISMFDDVRQELFQPALQDLGGAHEAEELGKMILQPEGVLTGLQGRLLARGWQPRLLIRPSFLEIIGLVAPPK